MSLVVKTVHPPTSPEWVAALDPGIRSLVVVLRARGWDTTDSGDGVSKVGGPQDVDGNVLPFPHVAVNVPANADPIRSAHELAQDIRELCGPTWDVELTYSTRDRTCVLLASERGR